MQVRKKKAGRHEEEKSQEVMYSHVGLGVERLLADGFQLN